MKWGHEGWLCPRDMSKIDDDFLKVLKARYESFGIAVRIVKHHTGRNEVQVDYDMEVN